MDAREIEEFEGFTISTDSVIYKGDTKVIPHKDGYVNLSGRRMKPEKLMYKAFPEAVPGKPIIICDEGYNVTKDGRVFTVNQCKFMSNSVRKRHGTGKEDYTVRLPIKGGKKGFFVHRLVASTYLDNPDNLPEVNHKDGDPTNNNVDNLEWISKVANTQHAVDNYLYEGQQKAVLVRVNVDDEPREYKSMQQAADELGMASKNANKNISETCIKNASDKPNRGRDNKLHPFTSEGYIFTYK